MLLDRQARDARLVGRPCERRGVDPDGERGHHEGVAVPHVGAVVEDLAMLVAAHHLPDGQDVALGLQPEDVVGRDPTRQPVDLGQGHHVARVRERDVQEQADPVAYAQLPHLVRDHQEVVVLDPDQVVRGHDVGDRPRDPRVDRGVGLEVPLRDVQKIGPVVEERPEDGVRVAQVEAAMLLSGDREGAPLVVAAVDRLQRVGRFV